MGINQKLPYFSDLLFYMLRISIFFAVFYLLAMYFPINLVLAGIFTIFIAQHISNITKILLTTTYFFLNYVSNQFIFSELLILVIYGLVSIALTGITMLDLNRKIKKESK